VKRYRNDEHLETGSRAPTCPSASSLSGQNQDIALRASLSKELSALLERSGAPSTCGKCHGKAPGCCYQAVTVTSAEVRAIVGAYPELIRRIRPELERLAGLENQTFPHAFADPRKPHAGWNDVEGTAAWMDRREPCAFLTSAGFCSVYDVRPFACLLQVRNNRPFRCSPDPVNKGKHTRDLDTKDITVTMMIAGTKDSAAAGLPVWMGVGLSRAVLRVFELENPVGSEDS
jgi:hypothetical protein